MLVWLAAAAIMVGAVIAATQLTGGSSSNDVALSAANSKHRPCPTWTKATVKSKSGSYIDKRGAIQHLGDGAADKPLRRGCSPATPPATTAAGDPAATTDPADPGATTPAATTAPPGLDILAKDCTNSKLQPHTGFQIAPACVSTAFGEVASQDKDASLIIANAPTEVNVGQTFTLAVNTRNLVRDRFLGAGAGGYYVESSLLNADGLVRGHFHTACRMLTSDTTAPDPAPVPAFFVATEGGKGSATPDTVQVTVAGMPTAGTAQCAVWAGDGSHRIPMMQRANQIPAFDVVRIAVK